MAQRAEVLRLHEAGWSIRVIAAEVFGEARLRGRVERILTGGAMTELHKLLEVERRLEVIANLEQIQRDVLRRRRWRR